MIGHTSEMVEKRNPPGVTGEAVRTSVALLRARKNLTYAKLS